MDVMGNSDERKTKMMAMDAAPSPRQNRKSRGAGAGGGSEGGARAQAITRIVPQGPPAEERNFFQPGPAVHKLRHARPAQVEQGKERAGEGAPPRTGIVVALIGIPLRAVAIHTPPNPSTEHGRR